MHFSYVLLTTMLTPSFSPGDPVMVGTVLGFATLAISALIALYWIDEKRGSALLGKY